MKAHHIYHLGTGTLITDATGEAYQFFMNLPFGETMIKQGGYDYDNPYKFNDYGSKKIKYLFTERIQRSYELDVETGLYYYGARYGACPERSRGNPKISMWSSVDPLAEKYPSFNPYNYVLNNPVMLVDPTGMETEEHDWKPKFDKNGKVFYLREKNDNIETLISQYGLSAGVAAKLYFLSLGSGAISGDAVKAYTGNEILKLSTFKDKQKNLDHIMFAMMYSKGRGTQIDNTTVMVVSDFFDVSERTMALTIEGEGSTNINGHKINVHVFLGATTTSKGWRIKEEQNYSLAYSISINNSYDTRTNAERAKYSFNNSYFSEYLYMPDENQQLRAFNYASFSTPRTQTKYFESYFK